MDTIEKAFGKVLSNERKKLKLSQENLAFSADVDRSYISDLENGKFQPTLKIIFKLAKQLKIEPEDLVFKVKENLNK